jgi:pyruvate kinase
MIGRAREGEHRATNSSHRTSKPGEMVLLDDGKLRMQVLSTDGNGPRVDAVLSGGKLSRQQGMNLPNTKVSPALPHREGPQRP